MLSWLKTVFGKKAGRSAQPLRKKFSTFKPAIEQLEDRVMPASVLSASLFADGRLYVEGTEAADTIQVRQDSGQVSVQGIQIDYNGALTDSVDASLVKRIEVNDLGGDDAVRLDWGAQALAAALIRGSGKDSLTAVSQNITKTLAIDSDAVKFVLGSDYRAYSLGKDGWLNVDGVPQWSNVQDFSLDLENRMFQVQANALYRSREAFGINSSWDKMTDNLVKYVVTPENKCYTLSANGDLNIDGTLTWSNVQDFFFDSQNRLYQLTAGQLCRSGINFDYTTWQTLDNDPVKFGFGPNGKVYSLGKDGWLNIEGTPTWGGIRNFDMDGRARVLALAENGELFDVDARLTLARQVVSWVIDGRGRVLALDSNGDLSDVDARLTLARQVVSWVIDGRGRVLALDSNGDLSDVDARLTLARQVVSWVIDGRGRVLALDRNGDLSDVDARLTLARQVVSWAIDGRGRVLALDSNRDLSDVDARLTLARQVVSWATDRRGRVLALDSNRDLSDVDARLTLARQVVSWVIDGRGRVLALDSNGDLSDVDARLTLARQVVSWASDGRGRVLALDSNGDLSDVDARLTLARQVVSWASDRQGRVLALDSNRDLSDVDARLTLARNVHTFTFTPTGDLLVLEKSGNLYNFGTGKIFTRTFLDDFVAGFDYDANGTPIIVHSGVTLDAKGELRVIGTNQADSILVSGSSDGKLMTITFNTYQTFTFWVSSVRKITILGLDGDDIIRMDQGSYAYHAPAEYGPFPPKTPEVNVFGGNGADYIIGFGVHNSQLIGSGALPQCLFDGGPGDDIIYGGQGRNILMGGPGLNYLFTWGGHYIREDGAKEYDIVVQPGSVSDADISGYDKKITNGWDTTYVAQEGPYTLVYGPSQMMFVNNVPFWESLGNIVKTVTTVIAAGVVSSATGGATSGLFLAALGETAVTTFVAGLAGGAAGSIAGQVTSQILNGQPIRIDPIMVGIEALNGGLNAYMQHLQDLEEAARYAASFDKREFWAEVEYWAGGSSRMSNLYANNMCDPNNWDYNGCMDYMIDKLTNEGSNLQPVYSYRPPVLDPSIPVHQRSVDAFIIYHGAGGGFIGFFVSMLFTKNFAYNLAFGGIGFIGGVAFGGLTYNSTVSTPYR